MKKIVALTLSVLMCCAVFIACGKEEKVAKSYQDFEAAMGKTQELDSLSAKLDMDIKILAEMLTFSLCKPWQNRDFFNKYTLFSKIH